MINTNSGEIRQWSKNEFYQYVADIFIKAHYDYISDYIQKHRYNDKMLVSFRHGNFHLGVKGKDKQKLISLDNPWRMTKNIPDSVNYIVTSYLHYLSLDDIIKYILTLKEFNNSDTTTKIINHFLLLYQLTDSYKSCRNYLGQYIDITTKCLLANYNTITNVLKTNPNNIIELIKIFAYLVNWEDNEQTARIWTIYQNTIYKLVLTCNPTSKTLKAYLKTFCKLALSFSMPYSCRNFALPTSFELSAKWLDALLAVNSVNPNINFDWKVSFENEKDVQRLLNNLPICNANDDLFAFGIDYVSELFNATVIKNEKQVMSKSNPKHDLYEYTFLKNGHIKFINADKYTPVVQKWLNEHPEVNPSIADSRNDKIYQILHTVFKQLPNN